MGKRVSLCRSKQPDSNVPTDNQISRSSLSVLTQSIYENVRPPFGVEFISRKCFKKMAPNILSSSRGSFEQPLPSATPQA